MCGFILLLVRFTTKTANQQTKQNGGGFAYPQSLEPHLNPNQNPSPNPSPSPNAHHSQQRLNTLSGGAGAGGFITLNLTLTLILTLPYLERLICTVPLHDRKNSHLLCKFARHTAGSNSTAGYYNFARHTAETDECVHSKEVECKSPSSQDAACL